MIGFLFTKVNFNPQISTEYFFSRSNFAYKEYETISKLFPPKESLILVIKSSKYAVYSAEYTKQIQRLTNKILLLKGVESVYSLTKGPEDLANAWENLVWREIVFGESNDSTVINIAVLKKINPKIVSDIERIVETNKSESFEINFSGTPYLIEMIKRSMYTNLRILVIAILIISSIVIFLTFRSWSILIGTLISSISSVMLTTILSDFFKIPFGLLTPNLLITILLLTQAHIIFLSSAYFNTGNLKAAISRSLAPSLWSTLLITLGFCSIKISPAEPLKALGLGGMLGTLAAILIPYLIYPIFLILINPKTNVALTETHVNSKSRYSPHLLFYSLCIVLSLGIFGLTTDTSITNYFSANSIAKEGLTALDRHGGSSTLRLLVTNPDFSTLDNDASFQKMYSLHNKLANHKDIGAVVSLPLLMKESKKSFIAKLLPWSTLMGILSLDRFNHVADRFITKDRKQALFILRMKETGIDKPKATIIKEVEGIVNHYGLKVNHRGGPYPLQAELSSQIESSLESISIFLLTTIVIVALFITTNLASAWLLIVNMTLLGLAVLGIISMHSAVDILSVSVIFMAIFLSFNILIHAVFAAGKSILDQEFKAIIAISAIGIFSFLAIAFSEFIPMQNFSLAIIAGMVTVALFAYSLKINNPN